MAGLWRGQERPAVCTLLSPPWLQAGPLPRDRAAQERRVDLASRHFPQELHSVNGCDILGKVCCCSASWRI